MVTGCVPESRLKGSCSVTNSPLRRRKVVSYQSCSQPQVCPVVTISARKHAGTIGYPYGKKLTLTLPHDIHKNG